MGAPLYLVRSYEIHRSGHIIVKPFMGQMTSVAVTTECGKLVACRYVFIGLVVFR
jgi:hypothetical protein